MTRKLSILVGTLMLAPLLALEFSPTSAAASPALTFTGKAGNEWWVEVTITGADAASIARVDSRDSYGPWVALAHKPWGTWAASYHIEPGHLVLFQATLADGRVATSCAFTHPAGIAACGSVVPEVPGTSPPPPFTATFTPKPGNNWWVETNVAASGAIASVTASVNGGAAVTLPATAWGSYAKSFFVPTGSLVKFAASSTSGAVVVSPTVYQWPSAAPVASTPTPTPAPTPPPPVATVPAAPTLGASAGTQSAVLSWSAPANGGSAITGYKLYRATASGAETLYMTLGVLSTFTDSNLTAGTTYYYQLSATNAIGEGTRSAEAKATPAAPAPVPAPTPAPTPTPTPGTWAHTNIVSTTFWVGEIFDPTLPDGSQVCSTYDSQWAYHWSGVNKGTVPATAGGCQGSIVGGCDGVPGANSCATEKRTAANGYFPTSPQVTPKENPFYLDLPFDDINDATGFKTRCSVIPWANQAGFAGHCSDGGFSYMKNHWVQILGPNGNVCYGQVEDAGPSHGSLYH
ncbi:MAG: fibronectin type III domain-containing protein, partial [Candidatus Thermoplasmatota archaeon]